MPPNGGKDRERSLIGRRGHPVRFSHRGQRAALASRRLAVEAVGRLGEAKTFSDNNPYRPSTKLPGSPRPHAPLNGRHLQAAKSLSSLAALPSACTCKVTATSPLDFCVSPSRQDLHPFLPPFAVFEQTPLASSSSTSSIE